MRSKSIVLAFAGRALAHSTPSTMVALLLADLLAGPLLLLFSQSGQVVPQTPTDLTILV